MYGYAFGAAKADVWHTVDRHSMLYPGYRPAGELVEHGEGQGKGAWGAMTCDDVYCCLLLWH